MTKDNFISAFAGAVIALLVSEGWKYFLKFKKLRTERRIFKNYLTISILDVLEKYENDIEKAQRRISNYPTTDMLAHSDLYNISPLLSSGIFKEIGFNRLYEFFKNHKLHNECVDVYHTIEYLVALRPVDILNDFFTEYNSIKWIEPKDNFSKTTSIELNNVKIANCKSRYISSLGARKKAAEDVSITIKKLVANL